MKCVKNPTTDEIRRVNDSEALSLLRYGWYYVPKAAWKAQRKRPLQAQPLRRRA